MKLHPLRAARLAAAGLALVVVAAGAPLPARAESTMGVVATASFGIAELLDLATYRVHTVRRNTDGTVTDRTVNAVVGVPRPVNVDASALSPPDLVVEVLPAPPNRVVLEIARLGGGSLPLSVELLFDLPGPANGGVAVGYDALDSSAPGSFSTSLTFSSTPTTSDLGLDVNTGKSTSPLVLVGDLFTRGQGGSRIDPTSTRVRLDPVPSHIGARVATEVTANSVKADLSADVPTVAGVTVNETKAGRQRAVTALLDRLPRSTAVEIISDPDAHHDELRYEAASSIAAVTATVADTGGAAQTKVTATAKNVPTAMTLTLDSPPGCRRPRRGRRAVASGTSRSSPTD
jgi:hypothetical protein